MHWYQDPAITGLLGAVAGAIIGGAVSIFIWMKTRKVRRVDCAVADATSLLSFAPGIGEKLEVKYEGEEASAVFLFPLEIANTGTEPVEDQPVQIQLAPGSRVISYTTRTTPELGFGDISCVQQDAHHIHLKIALLNPGDRVLLEVISLNNPDDRIDVGLKNKGVEARIYNRRAAESVLSKLSGDASLTMFAALSAMPFVGNVGRALTTLELARRIDRISDRGESSANTRLQTDRVTRGR